MAKYPKSQQRKKPEGELRQSQLISTFGPGAMIDLLDQAVLVGGLDFWRYERGNTVEIQEPRLRDLLVERFRKAGLELSHQAFRSPPVADENGTTPDVGVPVLEFPTYFVCQSAACRTLVGKRALELKKNRLWHRCEQGEPSPTVPVRFVGACRRGHLQDFPWRYFVHELQGNAPCPMAKMRLLEDATGDFSGISLACHCGAKARLSTAVGGVQLPCEGHRPWLGGDAREECDERLRLLVRTASNSHFVQVVSALSVPEAGKEIEEAVQEHWDMLKVASAETLSAFLTVPKVKATLGEYDQAEILAAIGRLHRGSGAPRLPLRTAEFKQFTSAKLEVLGELPPRREPFFAREHKLPNKPSAVAKVVLAARLREVRAQIGFTRLEPVSADLQGEFDLGVQTARLGLAADWLPATEVQGEGAFMQLDEAKVRAWEMHPAVVKRSQLLQDGHAEAANLNPGLGPFPGARFYMLHSLSHLLITAISLECGYSASAIRERIYCTASRTDPTPMAAILLSTGSSGSEGTLGGLVDQGRHILQHLRRAFDQGRLCSNDPICACHSPARDPAERYLEGAACHGCLFISEPSCERYNRFLDRALVVPCLEHDAGLAFFPERP